MAEEVKPRLVKRLVMDAYQEGMESPSLRVMRKTDERHAWDLYAASAYGTYLRAQIQEEESGEATRHDIAVWAAGDADAMLEERRKRWGR